MTLARLPLRSYRRLALLLVLLPAALHGQDTLRVRSYNIRHGAGMDDSVDLRRAAAVILAWRPDRGALPGDR